MGNSTSKPPLEPSHIWYSETPVQFSQNLVQSLESSVETDTTRAKTLELHIQARVAEELKRLREREDETFKTIAAKLSSAEQELEKTGADISDEADRLKTLNRAVIQHSIDELKHKLDSRKKVVEIRELDREVDMARNDVIRCLRGNDRRPLDCWREVERFKEEVRRVEENWVEKVVR